MTCLIWCLVIFFLPLFTSADDHIRQYCIVGGGPAGLQLGHFFFHAKRDYVIYEKNSIPGSFFAKFPRHRALISLNRRNVREGRSKEFAMRHDWNSLLDVRPNETMARPVTERRKALFPDADVLVEYLRDFAAEQEDHVHYNVAVKAIDRDAALDRFSLSIQRQNSPGEELVHCRCVIVATGLWTPNSANKAVDGVEYLDGYEDIPETGEAYEGKTVVVLGMGNAAMETATAALPYAAETHVFARTRPLPQGGKGIRFASQTHYVGDIRAGRLQIMDNYFLKSLDTLGFDFFEKSRLLVIPCLGTKKCFWAVTPDDCADETCKTFHFKGRQRLNYKLTVLKWAKGGWLEKKIRGLIDRHFPGEFAAADVNDEGEVEGKGWAIQRVHEAQELIAQREEGGFSKNGINPEVFLQETMEELILHSAVLYKNQKLMDEVALLQARYAFSPFRHPVDHIIRCFGWHMDTSIFNSSVLPKTTHNGKYPALTSAYQVPDIPNLYFAGTLTHGLDFRRSAGGFIHGFRYTARALFHMLEEQNFAVPFPSVAIPLGSFKQGGLEMVNKGHEKILSMLMKRINEASGPYQMFQHLGDMIIFKKGDSQGGWTSSYYEDAPLDHFLKKFSGYPRLIFIFKYGDGFYGPKTLSKARVGSVHEVTADKSTFLHPKIMFYPAGSSNSTMNHWLTEDIFTHWVAATQYAPFAHFLARVIATVMGDPDNKEFLGSIKSEEAEPHELFLDSQCSCETEDCARKCFV